MGWPKCDFSNDRLCELDSDKEGVQKSQNFADVICEWPVGAKKQQGASGARGGSAAVSMPTEQSPPARFNFFELIPSRFSLCGGCLIL